MTAADTPSLAEAVASAHILVSSNDVQRLEVLHELRRSLQLCRTVRRLNSCSCIRLTAGLLERALMTMGLAYPG